MRAEADRLDDGADRAGLHQIAGLHRGPVLVPLAVHHREDPLRLGLDLARLGELRQRRHRRLVREEVLAGLHHADAEGRALAGDRGAGHEGDPLVVEDLLLAPGEDRLGILRAEGRREVRLLGVEADQLAAAADEGVAHPVDVAVVHADRGEPDARLAARLGGRRRGLGGVAAAGRQHQRSGRDGGGRQRRLQEGAPIGVLRVHVSMSPLSRARRAGVPRPVNDPPGGLFTACQDYSLPTSRRHRPAPCSAVVVQGGPVKRVFAASFLPSTIVALIVAAAVLVRADGTPQSLPFAQDWTNPGLITVNDNWTGVPGIQGFLGQGITGATGVDPQTAARDQRRGATTSTSSPTRPARTLSRRAASPSSRSPIRPSR